jgi:hypothetical protein
VDRISWLGGFFIFYELLVFEFIGLDLLIVKKLEACFVDSLAILLLDSALVWTHGILLHSF